MKEQFPGYKVSYGGEYEETLKSFSSLRITFALALLLIYVNLAAQFRSYVQPLLIMVSIPFTFLNRMLAVVIWCMLPLVSFLVVRYSERRSSAPMPDR